MIKTALLLFACLFVANVVRAEAIKQPPGLDVGQQYRLAFITSESRTATSSDIDSYNAFVQAVADAAPLGEWGLEWKAIAGTETVSARENTATDPLSDESVPVFRLDGTELSPSYSALWNADVATLPGDFTINELGDPLDLPDPSMVPVWTGTAPDGTIFFPGGDNGGPLGSRPNVIIGFAEGGSQSWFFETIRAPNSRFQMYAMSEVLTAIPEPNNSAHFFIVLAACLLVRERSLVGDSP